MENEYNSYSKGRDSEDIMVDFRNYLTISDGFDPEHFDEYSETSPFAPIEIGKYVLHLFASEDSYCSPQENTVDPYYYQAWEMMVEMKHPQYDMVVCTHEIFNQIGYPSFQEDDLYAAFVDTELVQEVFEHLVNKIELPTLKRPTRTSQRKKK